MSKPKKSKPHGAVNALGVPLRVKWPSVMLLCHNCTKQMNAAKKAIAKDMARGGPEPTERERALNAEVTAAIIAAEHEPTPEAWDRVAAAEQAIAESEDHDEDERAIARHGVHTARRRADVLRKGEKLVSAYAKYVAAHEDLAVADEAIAATDIFSAAERQGAATRAAECRSKIQRLLSGVDDVAGLVVKIKEWREAIGK